MTTSEATAMTTTTGGQIVPQFGEMSVQAVLDRRVKIGQVMNAVMKDGEHYGKIPGCGPKPTLFKAGAEVLAMTFGLSPRFRILKTELAGGHREYEVTCTLHNIASGVALGEGLGACSTMESKYRWRGGGRACPTCGERAIAKSKYDGWYCADKKGGCGTEFKGGTEGAAKIEAQSGGRTENPDIADTYNTVLKMAKKRAQIDATLTVLGASDALAQDLEDLHRRADRFDDAEDADFDMAPLDGGDRREPPRNGGNGNGRQQDSRSEPNQGPRPTDRQAPPPSNGNGQQRPQEGREATKDELAGLLADIARAADVKALKEVGKLIRTYGPETRRNLREPFDDRLNRLEDDARAEEGYQS